MGNILLQTPMRSAASSPTSRPAPAAIAKQLGDVSETQLAGNVGGGVKMRLAGPLRARFDYRVFRLRGEPLYPTVHRFYVGANLAF